MELQYVTTENLIYYVSIKFIFQLNYPHEYVLLPLHLGKPNFLLNCGKLLVQSVKLFSQKHQYLTVKKSGVATHTCCFYIWEVENGPQDSLAG